MKNIELFTQEDGLAYMVFGIMGIAYVTVCKLWLLTVPSTMPMFMFKDANSPMVAVGFIVGVMLFFNGLRIRGYRGK